MRIPLGDFGNVTPGVTRVADTSAIGAGVAQLGTAVGQVAEAQHLQRVGLARAQAANAVLEHRIAVNGAADAMRDRIASGEVSYDQARQSFDEDVSKIPAPKIDYLDPVGAEGLDRGLKQNAFAAGNAVDGYARQARRQDFQSQFTTGLDNLGKLAGTPGADIDSINAQASAFAPMAQAAGIPKDQVDHALQTFKDRNWLNNATQRAAESRDSIDGLQQLEKDLVDPNGFYAGKLDTDKRNAVLASVLSRRDVLQSRLQIAADRREARAERTVASIDRQIATGVPATPQQWATWATAVDGTSFSDEFKQLATEEQKTQQVLRAPVADQLAYVQQQEEKLQQGGGTVRDVANLARLKQAVKANVSLLQEAPLLFNANRTGQDMAPLDISALAQDDGGTQIADQMRDRVVTLQAMRKQYGDQVKLRPLLPQEAQVLSTAVNQASPRQTSQLFGELRNAVGDDQVYQAAVQQIAPDSPVKAMAGLLASKQRSLTLERNWIRDDVVASSRDVSTTMLAGDAILNRSKEQKAEDGRGQAKLFLPETQSLQNEFQSSVGGAFAGRPGAADLAFQAVQAYYVGKAAQNGRLAADSKDIDTKLVKEAVRATLGEVVDYHGNGEVLAPWGMGESQFEDAADTTLKAEMKRRGLEGQAGALGLRNLGESTFYVVQGRNFVYDKQGRPLTINIAGQP
jgi:hypothetical protein